MEWFKKIFYPCNRCKVVNSWKNSLSSCFTFYLEFLQLCHWTSWICFACHQLCALKIFLSFINYTIKVSGPAWFSRICGFQISSAPVQEENCFPTVLFKGSCFHFIFYLMLWCHLGPVSSSLRGLQLFDRQQPVTFFSLVFLFDKYKLKIIVIKVLGAYVMIGAVYTRAIRASL